MEFLSSFLIVENFEIPDPNQDPAWFWPIIGKFQILKNNFDPFQLIQDFFSIIFYMNRILPYYTFLTKQKSLLSENSSVTFCWFWSMFYSLKIRIRIAEKPGSTIIGSEGPTNNTASDSRLTRECRRAELGFPNRTTQKNQQNKASPSRVEYCNHRLGETSLRVMKR